MIFKIGSRHGTMANSMHASESQQTASLPTKNRFNIVPGFYVNVTQTRTGLGPFLVVPSATYIAVTRLHHTMSKHH